MIRRVARLGSGHTPSRQHAEYWENCTIPWFTLADVHQLRDGSRSVIMDTSEYISELGLANSAAELHPAGTVILSRTASVGFTAIVGCDMATSQDFATWTCGPELLPRFLLYALRGQPDQIERRKAGSTHKTIYMPDIETLRVPLPPLATQRAIADYLDAETLRIDALVAKKRRMIELLDEQEVSRSVRFVTGGEVAGTPSRSGLYGQVPTGWVETALRHLGCEVQTGPFGSQLHAEDYVMDGWPVVNPLNIVDGNIIAVDNMTISEAKRSELARHVLRAGDIVFGRRGEMGRAGLVTASQEGWLCGTGSLRLRLHSHHLIPPYLKLLLQTPAARAYFELASVGSTMDNLNSEIVLALPTLVPPLEVQARVVAEIKQRGDLNDRILVRLAMQIERLVEHRRALITAAVTGQLDIPGVAA
jgi:type I restriction enzyme S subunit